MKQLYNLKIVTSIEDFQEILMQSIGYIVRFENLHQTCHA